jgi:hypothetical protein
MKRESKPRCLDHEAAVPTAQLRRSTLQEVSWFRLIRLIGRHEILALYGTGVCISVLTLARRRSKADPD